MRLQSCGQQTRVLCIRTGRQGEERAKHAQRLQRDSVELQPRLETGRLKQPLQIGEAVGRLKKRHPCWARYSSIDSDAESPAHTTAVHEVRH